MELGNQMFGHSRGQFAVPDRGVYLDIFRPLFDHMHSDIYGRHFDNEVFEMHPYCWCDKEDCPQCGDTGTHQVNFYHKPSGLKISWYKYAFRDSYTNQQVTLAELRSVVDECIKSIPSEAITSSHHDLVPNKGGLTAEDALLAKMRRNTLVGAHASDHRLMTNEEYSRRKVQLAQAALPQESPPELKPFFKTNYFARQKQRAKIFQDLYARIIQNPTKDLHRYKHGIAEHIRKRALYTNWAFEEVRLQCQSVGITVKRRQWKKFVKLMHGGYSRPMTLGEKKAYAVKLTRRGYGLSTVVPALDACKTVTK